MFFIIDEGGIAEEVAYFWQVGEYLEELADGLGVVWGAREDVILVDAGLNRRDQDLICRRHAVSVLIDCLLSHSFVSAGPRRHTVVEAIVLDLVK